MVALTKSDLSAIKGIIKDETKPFKKRFDKVDSKLTVLETGQKRIEKKFDDLFDFIDRDVSHFRKKTAYHLGIDIAELSSPLK